MNKRTQATNISTKVRQAVIERDHKQCIFCGTHQMLSIAHRISRASGGKGIEKNLALVCIPCHKRLDQSIYRKEMLIIMERYLIGHYGKLENIIYKKGE